MESDFGTGESGQGQVRTRLLAVVATVLVLAFLKWSQVATMPLAFAAFLIALAWPLQVRLEKRLPRWASFALTILALLAALGLFFGALWWCAHLVGEKAPQYTQRLHALQAQLQGWARANGFQLPQGGIQQLASGGMAKSILASLVSAVSLMLLVIALAILGLLEVHGLRRKVERAFPEGHKARSLIDSVETIVHSYQKYLWACTVAAILQGVAVWLLAILVGLDFAIVWAVMAFLLNYVPTVGSAVAVIPPTLFALVQFDSFERPLAVFLGMAALQLIFGNYVDPLIQGRYVSLSPVAVLVSIVFWGWVWGVPGALLGVPITIGIAIAADHFPGTRWMARLLEEAPGKKK